MPQSKDLYKAEILAEALPYMRQFAGETFVIKFGGSAMGDPKLAETFAKDIVLLKQVGIHPIVVHGGGPQISQMLEKLKMRSSFVDGLRVTDQETVDIVEMVLCGSINKQIVSSVNAAGGIAVGISGKDGNLIKARKLRRTRRDPDSNIEKILDMGFVGEVTDINPDILMGFDESDIIPVIAPIGIGHQGETFNINADSVAGALASALAASKLIMLTDVEGVLNQDSALCPELTIVESERMIRKKIIHGGMIPKVETCIKALHHDTKAAHILDGRMAHVLLLEVFTEHGSGTMIIRQ